MTKQARAADLRRHAGRARRPPPPCWSRGRPLTSTFDNFDFGVSSSPARARTIVDGRSRRGAWGLGPPWGVGFGPSAGTSSRGRRGRPETDEVRERHKAATHQGTGHLAWHRRRPPFHMTMHPITTSRVLHCSRCRGSKKKKKKKKSSCGRRRPSCSSVVCEVQQVLHCLRRRTPRRHHLKDFEVQGAAPEQSTEGREKSSARPAPCGTRARAAARRGIGKRRDARTAPRTAAHRYHNRRYRSRRVAAGRRPRACTRRTRTNDQ